MKKCRDPSFVTPNNMRPRTLNSSQKAECSESNCMWSPCSSTVSSDDNNSPMNFNTFSWDKPSLEDKTVSFAWTLEHSVHRMEVDQRGSASRYVNVECSLEGRSEDSKIDSSTATTSLEPCLQTEEGKNLLSDSTHCVFLGETQTSTASIPEETPEVDVTALTTDDLSESGRSSPTTYESPLNLFESDSKDLAMAPWFQPGIPREVALEILYEKPVGSFIVRESTTKPGCYALSMRTPPGRNACGIAHYLIMHTKKGCKIKGFAKEFPSLTALVTHHSVMPELLPCPLHLSRRYHGSKSERDADNVFEHVDDNSSLFPEIQKMIASIGLTED